ncbi:MAG: ABC transporter substrate-binding protein, partial [Myxococcales bacterium]|nr:ABC transporter substrate-binding protein [Myxococcales bacterium]
MSRTSALNLAGLVAAVVASVLAAGGLGQGPSGAAPSAEVASIGGADRIASASTVADALLLELCAPRRVIAVTAQSAAGPDGYRYAGIPTIRSLDDVEAILGLRPDVVVAHNVADPSRVARLRAAGARVVDLGPLEGRASLAEDARTIGALCGAPAAGERWARTFERRMSRVAASVPARDRRRAIYLTVWGDRFMGGTDGTSYHDVLVAAGLRDVAEARFDGWPTYDVEELLELDPDLVVTREGMGAAIC